MEASQNQVSNEPLTELEMAHYNYEVLSRQFNVIVASVTSAFKKLGVTQLDITADEYNQTVADNLTIAVNRLPHGLNLFLLTPEMRAELEKQDGETIQ